MRLMSCDFDSVTVSCYNWSGVADFDISELCERADVTPRTVHFYVQQGLLPPAGSPGPGARYTQGHVARIKLIRLLQRQHLPLAEIARRTKGLNDEQVTALLAETKQRRPDDRGSALDYIRDVLAQPAHGRTTSRQTPAPSTEWRAVESSIDLKSVGAPAAPERSQWERFTLTDGIEVHIRRPMTRVEQRQFERLMAAARKIFADIEGEGQK
jgi:DNA-binding transcriptional MerR regulator